MLTWGDEKKNEQRRTTMLCDTIKRDGDFVNCDNTNEQDKPCMIGS